MIKSFLLVAGLVAMNSLHALEIDEKLTLRFLKVSNSKKTVLINRGAEDGLVLGNHAKFFITSGVIARGVVEKVSPSRSIWSLYRVVEPNDITDGKVLNLKIASPVKLTEDPTKSMKEESVPAGSDKMSLGDGEKETSVLEEADKKELEGLGLEEEKPTKEVTPKKEKVKATSEVSVQESPSVHMTSSKNWEVWGLVYLNSLSGTSENTSSTTTSSSSTTNSIIDFSVGFEHYFFESDGFLKNCSILGLVHKKTTESGGDIKLTNDWFEYGGGLNYHFYNSISDIGRPIGYFNLIGGLGSATVNQSVSGSDPFEVKGSNVFFAFGIGAKYIHSSGFGVRGQLDYYRSAETYDFPDGAKDKRTLAGPRMQFGLSYRF